MWRWLWLVAGLGDLLDASAECAVTDRLDSSGKHRQEVAGDKAGVADIVDHSLSCGGMEVGAKAGGIVGLNALGDEACDDSCQNIACSSRS